MKSSKWRRVWRWLPGVAISAAALFTLFRMANFQEMAQAFSLISPWVLLASTLLTVLSSMARTQAWRTLMGMRAPFWSSFHTINIGSLLNNLLPFRSGEFGRAILMGRTSRLGAFYVLSTVVIERVYDLAVAAGIVASTVPFVLGVDWARPLALGVLGVVLLGLVILYFLARYRLQVSGWLDNISRHLPFVQRVLLPALRSLLAGLEALTSVKVMALSFFWIALAWGTYFIVAYLFLIAFIPSPPFWWILFMNGVVAIGLSVPAAPGNIGVYEASVVGALSVLSFPLSQALAYALVMHITNWLIMTGLGILGLTRLGMTFGELSNNIEASRFARANL